MDINFELEYFKDKLEDLILVLSEDIYQMKKNIAFRNLFLFEDSTVLGELKYVLGNILDITKSAVALWLAERLLSTINGWKTERHLSE